MTSAGLSVQIALKPAPQSAFSIDVAFEVPPGVTILFGPSGAGKTTVLSAIAGLIRPSRGRIAVGGERWFDAEAGIDVPAHLRGVGLVFQSLALFPHLTALDNVAYGMPRTLPAPERRERARRWLARMRVPHLEDRRPPTFSGGEAQRVALARAFGREPRVLLLDEAFSALDEELRHALQADVRAYVTETKIPTVQITHQREEALALGDRVVVLEEGRVVRSGPIETLRGS